MYYAYSLTSLLSNKDLTEILQIESRRLSFFLDLASTHFSRVFNKQILQNFNNLEIKLLQLGKDLFLLELENIANDCIEEMNNVVHASQGKLVVKNTETGSDYFSIEVPLSSNSTYRNLNNDATFSLSDCKDSLTGYFSTTRNINEKHFSFFEQNFLKESFETFFRCLRIYLSFSEETKGFTEKIDKQRSLLNLCQEISLNLLNATSSDEIIDKLLYGIKEGFNFSALIFLTKIENKLYPHSSSPPEIAEKFKNGNFYLEVLPKCVLEGDPYWELDKCLDCRQCPGLTAISALKKSDLPIPQTSKFMEIYYDFGVEDAKSEFIICLGAKDEVYGILDMYRNTVSKINETEWYFLKSLCNVATLSFYKQNLLDRISNIEREETRGVMARDIVHTLNDNISSAITYSTQAQNAIKDIFDKSGGKGKDKKDFKVHTKKSSDATLKYLDNLQNVLLQQRNLVSRYENISRSEAKATEINLDKVIGDVININAYKAREKRIDIVRHFTGTKRSIYARETDIYLILWNLVNNAIKFTRDTKRSKITITQEYSTQSVSISIRDEGVGIREDHRSSVWDLGFSTPAPRQKYKTSGIGLTTVKDLISNIEGADIQFRSNVNQGTVFTLKINQPEGNYYERNQISSRGKIHNV